VPVSIPVRKPSSVPNFFYPAEWIQIGQVSHFEGLLQQLCNIQGDQKVSVHLMITVQKTCKKYFKQFQSLTMIM
jgi:hypothetical protein